MSEDTVRLALVAMMAGTGVGRDGRTRCQLALERADAALADPALDPVEAEGAHGELNLLCAICGACPRGKLMRRTPPPDARTTPPGRPHRGR